MKRTLCIVLLLIVTLPAALAVAERVDAGTAPEFSSADQALIRRNAALEQLVRRDPVLVRRALDAIAASKAETLPSYSDRSAKLPRPEPAPDPVHNPDLDQLGRSSPEAAHDLFQLIKKAAAGGGDKRARPSEARR
jgi:hypothetical protein